MKIKYKDKDLFETETFITFGLGETEIVVQQGDESIKLIFDFQEKEKEKLDINFAVVDAHTAKLTLTNFNTPFGAGVKEPIVVGTFMHRRLYFAFHVRPTGSVPNCKVVTFSAYLGEEVQDGQN